MQINIKDLRSIINTTLDSLENKYDKNIDIPNDYYWYLETSDLLNINKEPTLFNLGQISEDWNFIKNSNDNINGYTLKNISTILRLMSYDKDGDYILV